MASSSSSEQNPAENPERPHSEDPQQEMDQDEEEEEVAEDGSGKMEQEQEEVKEKPLPQQPPPSVIKKDDEDQLANGISKINLSELSLFNRTEEGEKGGCGGAGDEC